jgi:hypothetical protein
LVTSTGAKTGKGRSLREEDEKQSPGKGTGQKALEKEYSKQRD